VAVSGGLRFASIQAGGGHTCGLTAAGVAYCWGNNARGQLGTGGTAALSTTPVRVAGGHTWRMISTGDERTCGVTTGSVAYCWGVVSISRGAPPVPSTVTATSNTPARVPGAAAFSTLDAGHGGSCGIDLMGGARCWGDNYWGQLGNGTRDDSPTPVYVRMQW
jgi:alpha-tubulin suppressor-like RCC1 family protein